jgi:hypothetical protein
VTVRVKVVFELIAKLRVPLGDTGTDEPVVLSVIVAVSAFVVAHDRFTDVPGTTQQLLDSNVVMVKGCLTVIEIVAVVVPPGPVAVSVYVESAVGDTTKLPDVMVVPELPGKV